jgi:hypothetical protein
MVDDFEKFHGVALQSLISSFDTAVLIKKTSFSRSAYLINQSTGLYVKHASARLTPWNFSFREMDYLALRKLQDLTQQIYIYLVCGFVGTVALSLDEVLEVTDFFTNPESNCRITVRTKRGGSWDISGNAGELKRMKFKTDPWRGIELI